MLDWHEQSVCWSVEIEIGREYMRMCENCHRQRVCHSELSPCWSVKISVNRDCMWVASAGGVSRCALCMLVCEDWRCVTVYSLHVGL